MRSKNRSIASDPNDAGMPMTMGETLCGGTPQAANVALVDAEYRKSRY